MHLFGCEIKNHKNILALGAESNGNFSIFWNNIIYFSEDFGDLQDKSNFKKYKKELSDFIKKNKFKPDIILSDLHPNYIATYFAEKLAKKYKAEHIQVQHHIAHIFSAIGEKSLETKSYKLKAAIGIACDGTGYGLDGKIWGGEIFRIRTTNNKLQTDRIGYLENQILLGGELAIQEPARMLISILSRFLTKKEVHAHVKKYYSKQEFEILYNQLQQNFNCLETSSTGRILDAVSLLLGFCENKRNYKHETIDLLEKNSTKPYTIKPVVKNNILMTTPLFEYLIKNSDKDKNRLAATAQLYIAKGLWTITENHCKDIGCPTSKKSKRHLMSNVFFAGGIANNKIISKYLESKGVYTNKKIPRGDAGISFGQILYHLANPWN